MQNDIETALKLASDIAQQAPDNPQAFYLLSEACLRAGAAEQALTGATQAFALQQDSELLKAQLCLCMLQAGKVGESRQVSLDLAESQFSDPHACDIMNRVLTAHGAQDGAMRMAERAHELAPDVIHYQYNLAIALRRAGRNNEAEPLFDKVIEARPQDGEAWSARSDLRRQTADSNHVDELRAALSTASNPRLQLQLRSALAKELDDLEQHDAAFEELKAANDFRRSLGRYDVADDIATMQFVRSVFETLSDDRKGCESEAPIFIIGMPRSGTQILQRVLAAHPDVEVAGDSPFLVQSIFDLVKQRYAGKALSEQEVIEESKILDPDSIGRAYIEKAQPAHSEATRFIDMSPAHQLSLGVVRRALPNAKVIWTQRHPVAACFDIYKTLYQLAFPYSCVLDDLADYFIEFMKLMRHWQQLMPGYIHEVSFERLAADPANVVRDVADFCGLTFDDDLLQSIGLGDSVSMSDISNDGWRNYEEHLQPLIRKLDEAGLLESDHV